MTDVKRPTGDVYELVAAWVAGVGLTAAAEAAGMSRSTAWRRLQTPEVREMVAEVEAERRASLMEWARTVRGLADIVADEVVRVLSEAPSANTVVRLASVLLPEVRHLAESVDVAARLDALETRIQDDDGHSDLARVVGL